MVFWNGKCRKQSVSTNNRFVSCYTTLYLLDEFRTHRRTLCTVAALTMTIPVMTRMVSLLHMYSEDTSENIQTIIVSNASFPRDMGALFLFSPQAPPIAWTATLASTSRRLQHRSAPAARTANSRVRRGRQVQRPAPTAPPASTLMQVLKVCACEGERRELYACVCVCVFHIYICM